MALFKSTDWMEIEKLLEQKEMELLKKEGIVVSEGHMDGYKYNPKTVVKDLQTWEVKPMPNSIPKCNSANWSHSDVNFELGEGIAYVTLNRPDRNNSLSSSMKEALHDATFELYQRRDIRIVVLRAEGKMFCSGGDPKMFSEDLSQTEAQNKKDQLSLMKFLYYFQCVPQFVVGLAQGSAMGSGVGLLSCCDLVVAVRSARFTVTEVKIGHAPLAYAPFLARKVGPGYAKRILCAGENISADMAKSMGLVTDVVDDEMDFSKYVESVCDKVTLCAPNAAARAKNLVQNVSLRPLSMKLLEFTGGELADVRIGEEAIKGMVAVQAKTKPYWAENPIKPLY
jgi:methylglutaconyl-CoA hydratase